MSSWDHRGYSFPQRDGAVDRNDAYWWGNQNDPQLFPTGMSDQGDMHEPFGVLDFSAGQDV